jgi:hypothetical protein
MKRSHFNGKTHIGYQPIRVLKFNILHRWENIHPAFSQEYHSLMKKHGLKPCVNYDCTERAIFDSAFPGDLAIPFVDGNKEITIQETFLPFVWAMCYSHVVLFEEVNLKPRLNRMSGQKQDIDRDAVAGATNLYKYGVSLIRHFTPWDMVLLPNPEEYSESEFYVEKASGVFTFAMAFILLHELAHIELGHQDDYIPKADLLLAESDADRHAIDAMRRGALNPELKINCGIGMLMGFCSLLILKRELSSPNHPDIDERIEKVLRQQNPDDSSSLWGYASMSFRLWDDLYNAAKPRIHWPERSDTFKEVFYLILKQLRGYK